MYAGLDKNPVLWCNVQSSTLIKRDGKDSISPVYQAKERQLCYEKTSDKYIHSSGIRCFRRSVDTVGSNNAASV